MIVDERNVPGDEYSLLFAARFELDVFLQMNTEVDGQTGDVFRREALRFCGDRVMSGSHGSKAIIARALG